MDTAQKRCGAEMGWQRRYLWGKKILFSGKSGTKE